MCKPVARTLPIHSDGPCGFTIRSHSDACAAYSLATTWRGALANVLRRWADKAEGVQSLVIVGYGPPQIVFSDVVDGATVGFNGATKYLNDLWRDRVHGSTEARTITPTLKIR